MESTNGTHPGTKRIELQDGQWAEIRMTPAVTAADMRLSQLSRVRDERGIDLFLDTLATFPTRIVQWSFGPVDQATIDALGSEDTMTLLRAMVGMPEPDAVEEVTEESPLVDSSDGGTVPTKAKSRRGYGSPVA